MAKIKVGPPKKKGIVPFGKGSKHVTEQKPKSPLNTKSAWLLLLTKYIQLNKNK